MQRWAYEARPIDAWMRPLEGECTLLLSRNSFKRLCWISTETNLSFMLQVNHLFALLSDTKAVYVCVNVDSRGRNSLFTFSGSIRQQGRGVSRTTAPLAVYNRLSCWGAFLRSSWGLDLGPLVVTVSPRGILPPRKKKYEHLRNIFQVLSSRTASYIWRWVLFSTRLSPWWILCVSVYCCREQ